MMDLSPRFKMVFTIVASLWLQACTSQQELSEPEQQTILSSAFGRFFNVHDNWNINTSS